MPAVSTRKVGGDRWSKDLDDTSPMPFGQYKNSPMQDVPAGYLHWLWTNGMADNRKHPVHKYIVSRLNALEQEHPDGVW